MWYEVVGGEPPGPKRHLGENRSAVVTRKKIILI
jgi:hypothetical protein